MPMCRRTKVSHPAPGEKIKIRKGKIIEQHADLYAASWATTSAQKNRKNRYCCDWLIKAAKEIKSLYPRGEKRMSESDSSTIICRIDTMIKVLNDTKHMTLTTTTEKGINNE